MAYRDPKQQRACAAQHYQKNKDIYKARARQNNQKCYWEMRVYVDQIKESTPCVDCNKNLPAAAMDFHHVGTKDASISSLLSQGSWRRLKEELAQCIVLCANCHRIRHRSKAR